MAYGTPSWWAQRARNNGVRAKKRLSPDYAGVDCFISKKQSKALRAAKPVSKAKADQERLQQQAIQVFDHWQKHGDSTLMTQLVLSSPGIRTRNALVAWFETVCGIKWVEAIGRFRKDIAREPVTREAATAMPIMSVAKSKHKAPLSPVDGSAARPRCSVCGHTSMPGEDTCYHHQSG
jgi:hypothetical protein